VIKSGETLQEISQKYYGTTKNWRKIANANKSKIKDANKLPVGVKITIP
jgi:nucleoid-associated protein YgaU